MAIQGLRGSGNFAVDERPKNWREGLLFLAPNGNAPLTALTSKMKKRTTTDPQFHWWEKVRNERRFELDAATGDLTTSNTALILEAGQNAQNLKAGDCLLVEQTGEIVQITTDPTSASGMTVTRGVAGSTPAALDPNGVGINPNLLYIGSANEEGSLPPTGVNYDPVKAFNYTQIFRDTLEITRTASKTKLRTTEAIKEAKRETLEIHSQGLERAFWLGGRLEGAKNGQILRYTGGYKYFLDNFNSGSNVKNAKTDHAAGVTMEGLEEYMYEAFRYGSNEKVAFCGNRALLTIQQIVRKNSSMQIHSGIKEFGMNVARLDTPFGSLVLKNHPMFNEVTGGSTGGTAYYGMEAWMAIVDMANLMYVPLEGGDTKYEKDLQVNGMDGLKSGYITECGMEFHHPRSHFLVTAMHSAAVDI